MNSVTFENGPMTMAGSKASSLWHSADLYAKAPGPRNLALIDGATHMDLYDGAGADEVAVELSPFFERNLVASTATAPVAG